MAPTDSPFTVAAVQTAPVFLNRGATVDKACQLIAEAAHNGARLVVFPECFVPTYPIWAWFIQPMKTRELRDMYTELLDNAVTVPSDVTDRLGAAARESKVAVSIGINEVNVESSGATLFNANLLIGPDGTIVGRRRKLMPTAAERLVHGVGDGSTLEVSDLDIGRLSCLICWENYMPLARHAMWAWGAQIHLAPTWDRGEPWISTLRHTAKEGRVYVIGSCAAVRVDDIPDRYPFKAALPDGMEWVNPGDSAIVDPDGKFVAGPVNGEQAILYGAIEPRNFRGPRFQLDVAGHYGRPDIFALTVNRTARSAVDTVVDDAMMSEEDAEEI